jgi:hypothetical protein
MSNQSKKNDPRFWRKWKASGAVSSENEHFDKCMAFAARHELEAIAASKIEGADARLRCGEELMKSMVMSVAAQNDYTNWQTFPKPPLGKMPLLHQAYRGTGECLYCGKPMDDWKPMEKCPERYDEKVA